MGARQSKRSVDITTTPKKEGIPAEGGVVGDAAAPGDGKLERIEEADTKPTTNGIAPHTDSAEDKEKDKDEATEKDKEQVSDIYLFILLMVFILCVYLHLREKKEIHRKARSDRSRINAIDIATSNFFVSMFRFES